MHYVLGGLAFALLAVIVVGGLTGRVRMNSCCSVPIERDLRMRGAFEDEQGTSAGSSDQSGRSNECQPVEVEPPA